MARLERVHQKIFASKAPTSDIGVIGSLHEGNPTEASSVQDIQSLPAFEAGIRSIVIGENSPIIEEDNALYKLITHQLAYLFQNPIPEWSPDAQYEINSLVTHNGKFYISTWEQSGEESEPELPGAYWSQIYLQASAMPDHHISRQKLSVPVQANQFYNAGQTDTGGAFVEIISITTSNQTGSHLVFRSADPTLPSSLQFVSDTNGSLADIKITKKVGSGPEIDINRNQFSSINGNLRIPLGSLNTFDPASEEEKSGELATYKVYVKIDKGSATNCTLFINNARLNVVGV